MPEEPQLDTGGPELSAAFRLGFYARCGERTVLDEVVRTLRTEISPIAFRRLREAVAGSGGANVAGGSLSAVADRALHLKHPCRPLYDLGAALGDYYRHLLETAEPSETGKVWDCVRRLPSQLMQHAGFLHELAEEADGGQDLEALIRWVRSPCENVDKTDDQLRGEENYREFREQLPSCYLKALNAMENYVVVEFVSELSQELAELPCGLRAVSRQSVSGWDEPPSVTPGSTTTPDRTWRRGYLGLHFDDANHVVRREGTEGELELSQLNWHLLQILDSYGESYAARNALRRAWKQAGLGDPENVRIDDALTDLRKRIKELGLKTRLSRGVGWTLVPVNTPSRSSTEKTRKKTITEKKKQ